MFDTQIDVKSIVSHNLTYEELKPIIDSVI